MITRKQTRQNYDRMSRWYDWFAASEVKFTQSGLQLLGVKEGERVLEIGSGTGHSLVTLSQQAGESGLVTGVELSPGMIEVAQKRMQAEAPESSVQIIQGDGTQLPFAPDSFEAVFLSFTLELFSDEDMLELLDECHRTLKPDGRLGVVSLEKEDVLACRLYEWGHERWPVLLDCRPIELRKCLETGGFRVQAAKVETMWGLPVKIALIRPF
jgi:demethylmenaquinone methyltransferase/2-methoxy-6-polyprenyl-1,4-benzoquinol methylase